MPTSILIVEDEPTILNSYSFVLHKKGYTITPVSSGAQALEIIKTQQFDVIVLDMLMPEVSGLDFLRTITPRTSMPHTKVLVLSNTESPKIIEEAKSLGASDYILKIDVTPYDLADRIAVLVGS